MLEPYINMVTTHYLKESMVKLHVFIFVLLCWGSEDGKGEIISDRRE